MNVSVEDKLLLIEQEIAMYERTSYILSVRHRVNKKIGSSAEQLKALEDEMAKIEQALDELGKLKKELVLVAA